MWQINMTDFPEVITKRYMHNDETYLVDSGPRVTSLEPKSTQLSLSDIGGLDFICSVQWHKQHFTSATNRCNNRINYLEVNLFSHVPIHWDGLIMSVELGCTCLSHTDTASAAIFMPPVTHNRVAFQRILLYIPTERSRDIFFLNCLWQSFLFQIFTSGIFLASLWRHSVRLALFQLSPPLGEHGLCWSSCTKPLAAVKTMKLGQGMCHFRIYFYIFICKRTQGQWNSINMSNIILCYEVLYLVHAVLGHLRFMQLG
jgi:hypothetical protein